MLSPDQIDQARKVDVLSLATRYTTLKRVAATGGGEYAGPCPVCGGHDRFHVQVEGNRWFCRSCTGSPEQGGWKDAIDLQMRLSGGTFAEAVQSLTHATYVEATRPAGKPSLPPRLDGPPGEQWQKRGQALVERSQEALWGKAGSVSIDWQETDPPTGGVSIRRISPRDWLAERGLESSTLRNAQIGYIPVKWQDKAANWGLEGQPVFVPPGIVIPSRIQGNLWNLKIRRPVGKPKYTQIRGGRPALYMADTLLAAPEVACITEGEFDALLLRQCIEHASNPRWRGLGVITLGSNSNYLTLEHWARYLYLVKHFLLLYDQDDKSQAAIQFWENLSARTRVVKWRNLRLGDKDLTDYHRSGGRLLDLVSWAIMQIDYESHPGSEAADHASQGLYPGDAATEQPAANHVEADSPATDRIPWPAAPEPEQQEVVMSIEEMVAYARANGLRIKFVAWPKGAPRPLVECE